MFFEFFSRYFSRDLELLFLFELQYALFDDVVLVLLVDFTTLTNCFTDLVESADDVLCYFEFQFVDIGIVDVFEGIAYECFIDTLAEHGAGFNDKAHFRFSEKLSC
jgi:hypothetical protein